VILILGDSEICFSIREIREIRETGLFVSRYVVWAAPDMFHDMFVY
jgi:hypothetical protein